MPNEINHGFFKEYTPTPEERKMRELRRRVRNLEEDNIRLHKELEEMKRILGEIIERD